MTEESRFMHTEDKSKYLQWESRNQVVLGQIRSMERFVKEELDKGVSQEELAEHMRKLVEGLNKILNQLEKKE